MLLNAASFGCDCCCCCNSHCYHDYYHHHTSVVIIAVNAGGMRVYLGVQVQAGHRATQIWSRQTWYSSRHHLHMWSAMQTGYAISIQTRYGAARSSSKIIKTTVTSIAEGVSPQRELPGAGHCLWLSWPTKRLTLLSSCTSVPTSGFSSNRALCHRHCHLCLCWPLLQQCLG